MVCTMKSALALIFLSSTALAWPVDVYVDAKVGEEKFQKAAGTEWIDVGTPSVALIEILPGDELLVTGKKNGTSKVLLYGEGRMGVWSVTACDGEAGPKAATTSEFWPIRMCGVPALIEAAQTKAPSADEKDALLAAARKACPGLRTNPSSPSDKLVADIRTEPCRKALLPLLKTDAFHSREITLTFEIVVLQSQLREIQTAIDASIGAKRVEALYAGGSLRLKGSLTMAEHRKVLWTVFDNAVGRVTLDDRLVLTDKPAADAGTAAPK